MKTTLRDQATPKKVIFPQKKLYFLAWYLDG